MYSWTSALLASGGHILVESELGAGTIFKVLLPLIDGEPEARPSATSAQTAVASGGVVLLVEDDQAVRTLATRVLERAGYTVHQAPNGRAALDLAAGLESEIDLVLTDVVMPEVGGVELADRLREAYPHMRVILASGYSEADLRGEVRHRGAAFLTKPFTRESLLSVVARVMAESAGP